MREVPNPNGEDFEPIWVTDEDEDGSEKPLDRVRDRAASGAYATYLPSTTQRTVSKDALRGKTYYVQDLPQEGSSEPADEGEYGYELDPNGGDDLEYVIKNGEKVYVSAQPRSQRATESKIPLTPPFQTRTVAEVDPWDYVTPPTSPVAASPYTGCSSRSYPMPMEAAPQPKARAQSAIGAAMPKHRRQRSTSDVMTLDPLSAPLVSPARPSTPSGSSLSILVPEDNAPKITIEREDE